MMLEKFLEYVSISSVVVCDVAAMSSNTSTIPENTLYPEFKMAAANILNFKKLIPFSNFVTNSHQIWL